MPYKSQKQMAMMHAKMPQMAARWDAEMKAKGQKFPTKKAAKKTAPKRKGK
jgi:hypothetical protein